MVSATKGDTLWDLARKYYGNGELAYIIAYANGLTIDDKGNCNIEVGQSLYIPAMSGMGQNVPDFPYGFGFLDNNQYGVVTARYQNPNNNDSIFIESEYSKGGVTPTNLELYAVPFIGAASRYGVGIKALTQATVDTAVGEIVGFGVQKGSQAAFEYYMNLVEQLDVKTGLNQAVFYSGPGNRQLAESFAKNNGKMTLEMTPGGSFLDRLKLFSNNSPLTRVC